MAFEPLFLWGEGAELKLWNSPFLLLWHKDWVVLEAYGKELCLCLKQALNLPTCSKTFLLLRQHVPERVCSTEGVIPTLVPWKGSVEGRGGCPTRKVAGAGGSVLCRTNDPGHRVSPAPLLCLAVFIPTCTWLPSFRDQGLQGMTGSFQFLWVVMVFRARQAAKGRLVVTIFCGSTWRLGSVWQYLFVFLGPISAA